MAIVTYILDGWYLGRDKEEVTRSGNWGKGIVYEALEGVFEKYKL